LLDVEPDLPPLVDEPDAERLIGLGDAPVLERERVAVGEARLAQEALGLGAAGVDVAAARTPTSTQTFTRRIEAS
jgi:hypothetical protein